MNDTSSIVSKTIHFLLDELHEYDRNSLLDDLSADYPYLIKCIGDQLIDGTTEMGSHAGIGDVHDVDTAIYAGELTKQTRRIREHAEEHTRAELAECEAKYTKMKHQLQALRDAITTLVYAPNELGKYDRPAEQYVNVAGIKNELINILDKSYRA